MSQYKILGRRLEILGRQKQSSPGGSDRKCWAESRSSSEWERELHKNMLATCSLMYIQLIFIACNIKVFLITI